MTYITKGGGVGCRNKTAFTEGNHLNSERVGGAAQSYSAEIFANNQCDRMKAAGW